MGAILRSWVWRSCRYARIDGRGGFASEELGQRFRAAAYRAVGLPLPAAAPRTITLLTAVDAEEVRNSLT